jgi:transcription elongation factor Elf1
MVDEQWDSTSSFPPSTTCPFCGGYASVKKTKNRRVSAYCSRCGSRVFLNSWAALEGYKELSAQVDRNREQWICEMDQRAAQAQVGPQTRTSEIDRVVLGEHLDRAVRGDATSLRWVLALVDGAQALAAHAQRKAHEATAPVSFSLATGAVEVSP